MGGAFRDDEVAARERADALDERVRQLEAENFALEARLATSAMTDTGSRKKGPGLGLIVLGIGALGLGSSLILVRALPMAMLIAVALMATALVWGVVLRQHITAGPGELWVVSGGRGVPQADGSATGYRVLLPGERRLLLPLTEIATSMSLRPFRVEALLEHAYSQGGKAVRARAVAMLALDRGNLGPAIERFLGQPESAIARVAVEVVESALRGALVDAPAQQPEALEAALRVAVTEDLRRFGLTLDTLLTVETHDAAV